MSKSSTSLLTGSAAGSVPPPRLDTANVLGCAYGQYPWDDWQRWAEARGLDADLAGLGRLVIREAYNHGWEERLLLLCGWRDDGQRMLKLALRSPQIAQQRWQRLLDTDGGRGEWVNGEWRPR